MYYEKELSIKKNQASFVVKNITCSNKEPVITNPDPFNQ